MSILKLDWSTKPMVKLSYISKENATYTPTKHKIYRKKYTYIHLCTNEHIHTHAHI